MLRFLRVTLIAALPIVLLVAAVVVPLAREYAELRRAWGLGRLGALAATSTLFPSLGIGLAVSFPLDGTPAVRWLVAVAVTIATYSLALAALRPEAATEAPRRSS
jgi:hypothetical protein